MTGTGGTGPRRQIRRLLGALAAGLLLLAVLPPARAQTAPAGARGPDDWDVSINSLPVAFQTSVPPVLPIDVGAGVGFAGIAGSSLPLILATVGPVYAPVLDALGLLGGTGALAPIALKLIPSLLLGGSTVFGLPPLPIDPALLPQPPALPLPSPELPVVQCTAEFPGDPRQVTCGGPQQIFLGSQVGAFSGTAQVDGDPTDTDTIDARSSVRASGLEPDAGSTLAPVSANVLNATSTLKTTGGSIQGATSVEVGGIDLLDGLVHVESVRTSIAASLTGRPGEAAVNVQPCEIAGVKIAGVPVTMSAEGLTVDRSTTPIPIGGLLGGVADLVRELTQQGGQSLRQLSFPADFGVVSIKALPPVVPAVAEDGTRIEARASCLEVSYTIAASASSIRTTVGQSALSMSAFRGDSGGGPPSDGDGGSGGLTLDAAGGIPSPELGSAPALVPDLADLPEAPPAGSGAPPPSDVPVFRTVVARAPDWLPVLLAALGAGVMSLGLVRGRRATWRGAV
ncbi:MAG: hypothetical protein Q8K58_04340 [Acidimicrobiales bacterium]|nr:hypothetical protein [Acidimicrobiales bacterium]